MSKNREKNQIVSFRLIRSGDGTFKITQQETMNRTKRMIAFDKGLDWNEVTVGKNLKDDLGYKEGEKKDLEGLIENIFFRDVNAIIDSKDLVKATTVRDLYEMIWSICIVHDEISTKRIARSIDRIPKITEPETMIRTKKMIAKIKEEDWKKITVRQNLTNDLMYEKNDRKKLKALIENFYFKDVKVVAKTSDLMRAATVEDVLNLIWDKYIDNKYKEYEK